MTNAATTMPATDVTYDAFPRSRATLTARGSLDSLRRANTAMHYSQNTGILAVLELLSVQMCVRACVCLCVCLIFLVYKISPKL